MTVEEYKTEILDYASLVSLLRRLSEKNIGIVLVGRPFPIWVHVMRSGDRATVREMEIE